MLVLVLNKGFALGKKNNLIAEGKREKYDNMLNCLAFFLSGLTYWLMQNRYILAVSPSEINDIIATNLCETESVRFSVMNNKTKCLCFINVSGKMFVGFANVHLRMPKELMAISISFLGMSVHMYLPQIK